MNTDQLNVCLRNIPIFCGTWASDELSHLKMKKHPYCIVANTDLKTGKGKNWVGFYVEKGSIDFFDTYGRDVLPCFKYFLNKRRKYKYNKKRIQSYGSSVCGEYCIYFLYQRYKGLSMSQIVNKFSNNSLLNDYYIKVWMRNKFGKCSIKGPGGQICQSYNCSQH